MAQQRSNHVVAFVVVGLGMVLIAALAGVAVWVVTRRRALAAPDRLPAGALATSEPAEA